MRFEVNSIKDLPDIQRMGQTCVNLNGDLLFIWGGSSESGAQSAKNSHLWIYETLTGYWRHRYCSGECPPFLSGSTSCLIGQKMYVYGGHSTLQDNWLNNIYCLNLENFTWRDLQKLPISTTPSSAQDQRTNQQQALKAEPTKPIKSDKCVSWTHEEKFYIFGGYGWSQIEHLTQLLDRQKDLQLTPDYRWPKFGWNNQLVEFNPKDNTWRWPSYQGKCPTARAAHSGAIMGDHYYLFGGRDSRERLNDLYTLNMKTLQWTQITNFSNENFLERPIRATGNRNSVEATDRATGRGEENSVLLVDRMEEIMMSGDDQEQQQQHNLTPSPSSSAHMHQDFGGPSGEGPAGDQMMDLEEEEEEEEDFEYPHPSHLLERWSLSTNQSTSCSNQQNYNDLDNCPTRQDEARVETSSCITFSNNVQVNQATQQAEADDSNHHNNITHQSPTQQQSSDDCPSPTRPNSVAIPMPIGRSFASFTPISSENLMLYGGISSQDENLHDCWIYNIKSKTWASIHPSDNATKYPRLWHSAARTKNNEVIIFGGSSTDKIDDFCPDVLTISLEAKSLKQLSLDCIARSIKMRSINKVHGLPSTVYKLIKLRKQALALTTISRPSNR